MYGISCREACECSQRMRIFRSPVYYTVSEVVNRPDIGKYRTYGICFRCSGRNKILHDISVNPKVVKHIVDLINRNKVSPVHLLDVVRDLLP